MQKFQMEDLIQILVFKFFLKEKKRKFTFFNGVFTII